MKIQDYTEEELQRFASHAATVLESRLLQGGMRVSGGTAFREEGDLEYHGQVIKFSGQSFQAWVDQNLPIAQSLYPLNFKKILAGEFEVPPQEASEVAAIMMGHYALVKSILPAGEMINLNSENFCGGQCYFDADVAIPVLYEPLSGAVWMSLTPQEVWTCLSGIKAAQGRVLVGGLGLGWQAQRILEKGAEQVVVVEREAALIAGVGAPLIERWGDRLTIVENDLWAELTPQRITEFDSLILDIWPAWGQAESDPDYEDVKRIAEALGKVCWAWGEVNPLRGIGEA